MKGSHRAHPLDVLSILGELLDSLQDDLYDLSRNAEKFVCLLPIGFHVL